MLYVEGFSQNKQNDNPLISYYYKKIENPIFKQDSLIKIESKKSFNSDIFNEFGENKEEFLDTYLCSVFNCIPKKNKRLHYINQWNTPILIYFDKSLSKALKESLVNFIKQIEEIDNLEISFVKDKDDANFLIRSTDKTFNVNYNFKNEKERLSYAFNNGIYIQMRDKRKKIRGCILELNNNDQTPVIMKKNLNQLFFLSLGRFSLIYNLDNQFSLLNAKNQYTDEISELDLAMLKIHYNVIYNSPVTSDQFTEIIKPNH